jgi:hypothetical protein
VRKGWKRFWRKRRGELRAVGGLCLAQSGQAATEEVRCRDRLAERIGKPRAKKIELVLALDDYGPAAFVVMSPLSWREWEQLRDIPQLFYPLEWQSQFK